MKTAMNSKENNTKLNKGVANNAEETLKILRNKEMTMAEKAKAIEKLSGIEQEDENNV